MSIYVIVNRDALFSHMPVPFCWKFSLPLPGIFKKKNTSVTQSQHIVVHGLSSEALHA